MSDLPFITKLETLFPSEEFRLFLALICLSHFVSWARKQVKNHSLNRMIQNVTVTLGEKPSSSPNGTVSGSQTPLVASQESTNQKAPSRKFHAKSSAYFKAWQRMLTFNMCTLFPLLTSITAEHLEVSPLPLKLKRVRIKTDYLKCWLRTASRLLFLHIINCLH